MQLRSIEAWAALAAMVTLALGCGDGPGRVAEDSHATAVDGGPAAAVQTCLGKRPGQSCGDARHCIDARCTLNVCGDGWASGSEACDDGNAVVGVGCSPSCTLRSVTCGDAVVDADEECDDGNGHDVDLCSNDCTANECGNAREEGSEECDDGNLVDDDACSQACTENRCRNGRLDPGEECDDGNQVHDDGCSNGCNEVRCGNAKVDDETRGGREECDDGNAIDNDDCANACTRNDCGNARIDPGEACDGATSSLTCSDDCMRADRNDACAECRSTQCKQTPDYGDVVTGCLEAEDEQFRRECTAILDCAKSNRCGYTEAGAPECFCGSAHLSDCQQAGRADGPCQAEWWAGAHTDSLAELVGNFGVVALPSGAAFYLMECERTSCPDECVP